MITVDEIIRGVRFKQKDNNEVNFSDYDILTSLNEALRYINQSYAMRNSDFLEKLKPYKIRDINKEIDEWNEEHPEEQKPHLRFEDGFDLPDDFLTIVNIRDTFGHPLSPCPADVPPRVHQYKIVGSKLYLHVDAVMLYRYVISDVKMDGEIELPRIFYDPIIKVTGMVLNNSPDTDVMMQEINTIVENLIPARRYANLDVPLPWKLRS